jgi:PAS domain S-box-containing protein/putative nucleotidyltransferase with HDIG domain
LGFSQQEWLEKSPGVWMAQVHPDDHERVHAGYVRCFLSGEPHDAEYRIRTADGRMIWLRDQAVRLSDENGKPHLIHGVMYDITERKQSEEALRESEEKYRLIAENTSDGIILFDADNRVKYVSPSFGRQLGYETEEFNLTPEEIYSFIHPDDHDLVFSDIYSAIELKKNGLTYSYRFKHKSGHYIWREDNAKFNYDDSGNYLGSHVICRDITERKLAEQAIRQRVTELEMLHQSGLALSRLLNPKEIGQKILELLKEKMDWHHTRIRLYSPQDDSLELLDFNQPGLNDETDRHEVVERFQSLITRSNQGMNGWVIQHGQTVRSGDVSHDPRYVQAYPGIRSGLYVPMKLGERIVGVISIEDEKPDAFSEADERLIATLANQAASAFENARLFDETRQRVMELETLNRISLVLRAVTKQNEMLSIVLDEALAILNTSHGSIELHNKTTDLLEQTILRGWIAQVTMPHHINEGIAGKVFTSGEIYVSREFATDPETRPASRSQIPPGWGGVCLPIRTTQQTLGVMIVSMPSEHELSKDEIRLLATLSEMTGAALQRMQLYEQTVRRLEQLHALRAVDQAIASNLDMRLTLDIVLSHVVSQLGVDAADVLLFHPDTNLLEFITGHGFHTILPESVRLNSSLAARAILERRIISAHNFEIVNKNPHFWNLWKEEGFVCYWCVPLIVKGEVKGVMEVYCRADFTPDAEWLEFLDALTGQAAIAIDSTQLFENLQRANMDLSLAYDATIEGWSRAMDLRDHETEGHTLRVTDLTMKLARAMRVSESQLTAIRRGALLHDIGKMGVPDAILLKEGDLTDEEWVLMRKHPEFARDMLMPIAYLNDALNIPYCHHEKWDGTGYPQGLKGDQIPLVARIFAVVDVWDALTNDRTYRTKWSKQKARQYIKEQSGKHFDPQVVDVFLNQVEND